MSLGKGLGRGFESLIPTELIDDEFDITAEEDKKTSQLKEIKISEIIRDEEQPRRDFDAGAIAALAESIKEHGVLQPIVVTHEDGKYKIVAGERRWRASKEAGLKTIPALVRTLDSQKRLEIAVIENAQREDLNPIELATAYAKLMTQFNLTTKEIGQKVGKSEVSVGNTLRLLNLSDSAKRIMIEQKISEGVMRPLIAADPEMVEKILPKIIEEGWTSRKVERYVSDHKKQSSNNLVKQHLMHKDEEILEKQYGVKVKIVRRSITFSCKSEAEMKSLIKRFKQ